MICSSSFAMANSFSGGVQFELLNTPVPTNETKQHVAAGIVTAPTAHIQINVGQELTKRVQAANT